MNDSGRLWATWSDPSRPISTIARNPIFNIRRSGATHSNSQRLWTTGINFKNVYQVHESRIILHLPFASSVFEWYSICRSIPWRPSVGKHKCHDITQKHHTWRDNVPTLWSASGRGTGWKSRQDEDMFKHAYLLLLLVKATPIWFELARFPGFVFIQPCLTRVSPM